MIQGPINPGDIVEYMGEDFRRPHYVVVAQGKMKINDPLTTYTWKPCFIYRSMTRPGEFFVRDTDMFRKQFRLVEMG